MTATLRVRVLCSPFPRYTEKPCDNGQESSRVDEELRLLHNHRRARCLDVQCNAHCRLCTVGLRRTKRHCSSQFREYVATNYRPKRRVLGRVSVYSRYNILLSSVQTGPMHADSEWLCIGTKSSHSTFASSRICGYSSVGRYVGSPFHLRFHIFCVVSGLVLERLRVLPFTQR